MLLALWDFGMYSTGIFVNNWSPPVLGEPLGGEALVKEAGKWGLQW